MSEKQKSVEMAALKMPRECMDFLKRNPKLAAKAGKLMVMLFDMKETIKSLESLFTKAQLFQPILENGTSEELEVFLEACIKAQNTDGSVLHIGGIPPEAFDEIRAKMGDNMVATEVSFADEKQQEKQPKVNLFQRKNS